jgi:DNA polymerase (family 10)
VYQYLGLQWIPPELREDRGEIEAGLKNRLPKLVEMKDILGDFHNHTTLSDGKNTPAEMIQAAEELGWKWYFCGDHSPSLNVAGGLSIDALRGKLSFLKKLEGKFKKIKIFSGSEVDILPDGKMDYPDSVLEELDVVVGSVHSRFNQSADETTNRIIRALENPHVDILGHISGRLINSRPGYQINVESILEKARDTRTAIEINGQPDRLELSDVAHELRPACGPARVGGSQTHSQHPISRRNHNMAQK